MKNNLIIQLFIVFSICFGNTITVFVFDSKDSVPLVDANIILQSSENTSEGGSSNNEGKYTFNNIKTDTYTLSVSYIGYHDYKAEFVIDKESDYDKKY